jgi:hypothetical protein
MRFELRRILDEEVIDALDLPTKEEAKIYFMGRKQLKEKDFDNLFVVEKKPHITKVKPYKWWKEESTKLDDF